jgi:hypothetical protein
VNADEVLLIRDLRRLFDKVAIDSARLEVTVTRGHVQLRGTVTTLRSHPLVVVKEEFEELERKIRRDSRIKLLTAEVRILQPAMKQHQEFAAPHFAEEPPKTEEEKE